MEKGKTLITFNKGRLISITDNIMATMMTIMVVTIAVPVTTNLSQLRDMMEGIIILFVSFLNVAIFWQRHQRLFKNVNKVNTNTIWINFIFLFFLSLLAIFVAALVKDIGALVPIVCYGIVWICLSISFDLLTINLLGIKYGKAATKAPARDIFHEGIIFSTGIILVTVLAFFIPNYSPHIFLLIPILMLGLKNKFVTGGKKHPSSIKNAQKALELDEEDFIEGNKEEPTKSPQKEKKNK